MITESIIREKRKTINLNKEKWVLIKVFYYCSVQLFLDFLRTSTVLFPLWVFVSPIHIPKYLHSFFSYSFSVHFFIHKVAHIFVLLTHCLYWDYRIDHLSIWTHSKWYIIAPFNTLKRHRLCSVKKHFEHFSSYSYVPTRSVSKNNEYCEMKYKRRWG